MYYINHYSSCSGQLQKHYLEFRHAWEDAHAQDEYRYVRTEKVENAEITETLYLSDEEGE